MLQLCGERQSPSVNVLPAVGALGSLLPDYVGDQLHDYVGAPVGSLNYLSLFSPKMGRIHRYAELY